MKSKCGKWGEFDNFSPTLFSQLRMAAGFEIRRADSRFRVDREAYAAAFQEKNREDCLGGQSQLAEEPTSSSIASLLSNEAKTN